MAQIAILNKYRNELGRAYRKMYDNDTRHHRDELAAFNILRQALPNWRVTVRLHAVLRRRSSHVCIQEFHSL